MSIGIIGAGALGSDVARLLAKNGISTTIANNRGPESLARLVGDLGPWIKAGTVEDAASADLVLVAVRWVDLEKAPGGLPGRDGYSGDDANAKAEVRRMIEGTGYFAVDLGPLDVGGPPASLPFGSLASTNFVTI